MAEKSKGLGGNPGPGAEGAAPLPCDSLIEPADVSDFDVEPPTFSSTIGNIKLSLNDRYLFIFP